MSFQIHSLPYDQFAPLFSLDDAALAKRRARRSVVKESPGTPCRVSLQDAEVGETVILANWEHQAADTPYRATHGVFIRENALQVTPEPGEVPPFFLHRTMSLRVFSEDGMMTDAEVVDGHDVAARLTALLAKSDAAEVHIHFAAPGCFAARAVPA